ncbi:MAG: NADH-quinone oxidoreductase subunit N [Archaeoglobaceae archaeon]|nr:NADH-quinone oxidoreductase subunit N [Archaeoglobaceae archaeon]MCX8151931.1 NADH-quinone oxidoreductase subunit N [Archaeoglobaceae archaeon]MDW8013320.1 NADH-quinone oxidoreductase subunit N [Archaeoglobaceae archaeon]
MLELAILIILTIAAALSYWDRRFSLALSLLAIFAASVILPLAPLLTLVAFLGIIFLLVIKNNQIAGVDYVMVAFMLVVTVLAFVVKDLALLLTLFVAASVPTYLLVMIGDKLNIDIGIKYVTFMVLATILFIIGAALTYYGYEERSPLYIAGFLILLTGLCLEVGIAPVHEWVPDVFASADPVPVSIIASLAKFVPFVVAYKIFLVTANPLTAQLLFVVAIVSAISMFVGNIAALTSYEPSRILAYSTVANMGYILAAFSAIMSKELIYFALAGVLLQLFVNSFGKIGFFASIKGGGTSSLYSWILGVSFIGIPPLMGFWSKFFIIYALVFSNYVWLAIILILNSAISVPYYVRLSRILGTGWRRNIANTTALISAAAMLITVIPPTWFVDLVTMARW